MNSSLDQTIQSLLIPIGLNPGLCLLTQLRPVAGLAPLK
jgi:hypothetical protein